MKGNLVPAHDVSEALAGGVAHKRDRALASHSPNCTGGRDKCPLIIKGGKSMIKAATLSKMKLGQSTRNYVPQVANLHGEDEKGCLGHRPTLSQINMLKSSPFSGPGGSNEYARAVPCGPSNHSVAEN